jgi:hypothetical protein
MANRKHVGTIALPDTGKMLTVAYETDDAGAEVILTIGRIGADEPDATIELGASHTGGLHRFLKAAIFGIATDRGLAPPADPAPTSIIIWDDDDGEG